MFARLAYASFLGSVVLGPIYFTNQRFVALTKTRIEAVIINIANGKLVFASAYLSLLYIFVTAIAVSAATVGYGLILWPLVYSESLSTKEMVDDAAIIPLTCFFGALRWIWEMYSITLWSLIRLPKISIGLEGEKYDRLIKIRHGFVLVRFLGSRLTLAVSSIAFAIYDWVLGILSHWPLCLLLLPPSLMDKCVAHFDRYRGPVVEGAGPQAQG